MVARAAASLAGALVPLVFFVGHAAGTGTPAADPETESAPRPERRFALGLSAGSPQIVAVTGEYTLRPSLHLQANAGTLIVITAGSLRLIGVPETMKLAPYVFLGGGGLYILPLDGGGEEGFSRFTWWGFGLRLRAGRARVFVEGGELRGLNRNHGYESYYPAVAAGLLFTL